MRTAAKIALMLAAMLLSVSRADAGLVGGRYLTRAGKPIADAQLHFENQVSRDIYITRTARDGSFSAELPPGIYTLRADRGLVLRSNLMIDERNADIGVAYQGAPLDVRKPFEWEGLGPAIVQTGAPSTAHLATVEETQAASSDTGASRAAPIPGQVGAMPNPGTATTPSKH